MKQSKKKRDSFFVMDDPSIWASSSFSTCTSDSEFNPVRPTISKLEELDESWFSEAESVEPSKAKGINKAIANIDFFSEPEESESDASPSPRKAPRRKNSRRRKKRRTKSRKCLQFDTSKALLMGESATTIDSDFLSEFETEVSESEEVRRHGDKRRRSSDKKPSRRRRKQRSERKGKKDSVSDFYGTDKENNRSARDSLLGELDGSFSETSGFESAGNNFSGSRRRVLRRPSMSRMSEKDRCSRPHERRRRSHRKRGSDRSSRNSRDKPDEKSKRSVKLQMRCISETMLDKSSSKHEKTSCRPTVCRRPSAGDINNQDGWNQKDRQRGSVTDTELSPTRKLTNTLVARYSLSSIGISSHDKPSKNSLDTSFHSPSSIDSSSNTSRSKRFQMVLTGSIRKMTSSSSSKTSDRQGLNSTSMSTVNKIAPTGGTKQRSPKRFSLERSISYEEEKKHNTGTKSSLRVIRRSKSFDGDAVSSSASRSQDTSQKKHRLSRRGTDSKKDIWSPLMHQESEGNKGQNIFTWSFDFNEASKTNKSFVAEECPTIDLAGEETDKSYLPSGLGDVLRRKTVHEIKLGHSSSSRSVHKEQARGRRHSIASSLRLRRSSSARSLVADTSSQSSRHAQKQPSFYRPDHNTMVDDWFQSRRLRGANCRKTASASDLDTTNHSTEGMGIFGSRQQTV